WDNPADPTPDVNDDHGRIYTYSGKDGSLLFIVDGENAGDELGGNAASTNSVAGAGDVNLDGSADLLAGAAGWDDPQGGIDHGKVYVFSGTQLAFIADEHL